MKVTALTITVLKKSWEPAEICLLGMGQTNWVSQEEGTVDYFEQFCAISKVPMVMIKENIY